MPSRPSDLSWPGTPVPYSLLPPEERRSGRCPTAKGFRAALLPLLLLGLVLGAPAARAQDVPAPLPAPRPDSAAVAVPDSATALPDTLRRPAGAAPRRAPARDDASGIDKPVAFAATDSLSIVFSEDEGDRGRLVGNATVTYGDVRLEAYAIDILFDLEELRAEGLASDTGLVGTPRFQQGSDTFSGRSFAYNLGTERGRVVGARTQIEDGFIRAGVAKVREDSTLFILDGAYTTCNCGPDETPSYSLRSHKMKVVNNKWIYTGPIQLYLFDIPTPLWLPFGFLPAQEGRRSGILPPEYGEDQRGFYLRNWGYYWAINDYLDLQVRAGIWTKGSWQIHPAFRYSRRDRYNGQLNVDYLRERSGERDDPDLTIRNNASLRWNHNQTLNPTARLTANVNLTSSTYLRTVSDQYDDNVRQSVSSSIQYTKRWPATGRTLSLNVRQNQVLATGQVNLTLPELSFSQSTRTPFKRMQRPAGARESWYEKITVSYTGRLNNQYNFQPLPEDSLVARGATGIAWYDALFDAKKYERATGDEVPFEFTATHRIPVAAPFNINRLPLTGTPLRLTVSPSFNYSEDWFVETERRSVDSTNRVIVEQEPGFFALRQFTTGVSASTTVYGLFPIQAGPYRGLRHTVRPSLGFGYRPDFSKDFWGYTRTYADTSGRQIAYGIVRGVPSGLQQTLSMSLDNVFETKRVEADSTGEQQSRTLKLFNANLSTSYNFAADSLRLAPITLTARTSVLGLNLNFRSTFSPYALNAEGTREINRYVLSLRKFRFARMTQLTFNGDFSLRSQRTAPGRSPAPRVQPGAFDFDPAGTSSLGLTDPFSGSRLGGADDFADFSIPWSLNVRFSYGLSRPLTRLTRTFNVNSGFDFNLTPNWRVSGQTGYDFERQELVTTSLALYRDFECWEMSFRWVPFGRFQSWGFDLHVKSGKLRDFLRIRQPRSERDRGFGL